MKKIVFLCGARDFHAMDWYRIAKQRLGKEKVAVVADIISAEGLNSLLSPDDNLYKLIILDKFLFKTPSHKGDIWRNLLKFVLLPLQALKLRAIYRKDKDVVYHAHGMYYMRMAAMAHVPYVGSPQGSEILVRPVKSRIYKGFAKKALKAAKAVTVDSTNMAEGVERISGRTANIVQYGIDMKYIMNYLQTTMPPERSIWLSFRGFAPLYREKVLLEARSSSKKYQEHSISFVFPFFDDEYLQECKPLFTMKDVLLGRLPTRQELYEVMRGAEIAFSIPISDSSPRSVYEAIFMGCTVIISRNAYYDSLPRCMQDRIVIANLEEPDWMEKAVPKALEVSKNSFEPSEEAIRMFDQEESFKTILSLLMS